MIKLYFDEKEVDKDYYRSLTQSYILFDKSFCLGSVPANTFTIELNNKANINNFNQVKIELNDKDYAHVFYDNIDQSNNNKSVISLSDAMVDLEFYYDASPIIKASANGYVTLLEIVEDICNKIKISLATKDFNLKDMQISWYDNQLTARQYISFIATLNGGFAKINKKGELEFVRYTNNIKAEINSNTCLGFKIGEYHKITRVVWDAGVEVWEYGDETGNTLYLDTENPFITKKEDVESIFTLINGFEFYSIEISKCPINTTIEIGDTIGFKNGDKLYPFIAQLELNYNGGFRGGYKFVIDTAKIEETKIEGLEKKVKSIKTRLNRDEAELEIIAQETTETKNNLYTLSTPILKKEGNNHICIEEALETNAIEYIIEGKCEQKTRSGKNIFNMEIAPSVNNNALWNKESDGSLKITPDISKNNSGIYWSASKYESDKTLNKDFVFSFSAKSDNSKTLSMSGIESIKFGGVTLTEEWQRFSKKISAMESSTKHAIVFYDSSQDGIPFYLKEMQIEVDTTTVSAYEPYGKSPSVEYPSEIKTIKGKKMEQSSNVYWLQSILMNRENQQSPFYEEVKIFIDSSQNKDNQNSMESYELCSIEDIKDTLDVVSGKLIKRIGKINSYNGEEIQTKYLSTTGGLNKGSTIYYELKESEEIQLIPTNISLFEGENHIELDDDIETKTSIKYYRLNALNEAYYTKTENDAQLKITSDQISNTVSSTKTELKNDVNDLNNNLNSNFYQKKQVEQLILDSSSGLTNTFSEAGGNNILRNTNFSAKEVLEDGQIFEYWYGNVIRNTNESSANGYSITLQNNSFYQEQLLANGNYTLSFYYKKINPLATIFIKINDSQYELSSTDFSLFQTGLKDENGSYVTEPIVVRNNHIKVEFLCDINNACEVYDIMLNAGKVKLAYSQNQNETITDTVNIGRGIKIMSTASETEFVATNENIGFKNNSGNFTTKFNAKGMSTNEAVIKNEAEIVGIIRQKVGDQIWDCML